MRAWKCVLRLEPDRSVSSGSPSDLCRATRRGVDLRIYTEFRHNEHIDPSSDNPELIGESADFRVIYALCSPSARSETVAVDGLKNMR